MAQGKNILLEMNSFKPGPARCIIRAVDAFDADQHLEDLLVKVLLHYGIETDSMNASMFRLNFKDVTDENFPVSTRLSDTLTFKRNIAVVRDDVEFISWDHPFVHQVFEYFVTNNTGSPVHWPGLLAKNGMEFSLKRYSSWNVWPRHT